MTGKDHMEAAFHGGRNGGDFETWYRQYVLCAYCGKHAYQSAVHMCEGNPPLTDDTPVPVLDFRLKEEIPQSTQKVKPSSDVPWIIAILMTVLGCIYLILRAD